MADVVRIDGTDLPPPSEQADAHGQAALMLSESILHALIDAGTFTIEEALAIVQTAQEVKEEIGKDNGEWAGMVAASLRLLDSIATSLATDLQ